MRKITILCLACLVACSTHTTVPDASPSIQTGWNEVNGHLCYRPPDFEVAEGRSARRLLRANAMSEASKRWRGEKDSSFSLSPDTIDGLENALLSQPEFIETTLQQELTSCLAWARAEITLDTHRRWYRTHLTQLNQALCFVDPFELITQYIEVDQHWQAEIPMCQNQVIHIKALKGQYTVEAKDTDEHTTWIGAEGLQDQPANGLELPCSLEGCFRGQVVGRFVDRDGSALVFPVGLETYFQAPNHGTVTFGINDDTLYDNRFRTVDRVMDFLAVEIRPARASDIQ